MRPIVVFLIYAFTFNSCQEPKDYSADNFGSAFKKDVGKQIPLEVATRWVRQYHENNPGSRTMSHRQVTAPVFRALLYPMDNLLGVGFHHALDENGSHHILIIPYRPDVSVWSSDALDIETGTLINKQTAKIWSENYKTANPLRLWSFFFGKHVFDAILAADSFNHLQFVTGENDFAVEQLVLYAWYTSYSESGRSYNEEVEAYDASLLCPAACPN